MPMVKLIFLQKLLLEIWWLGQGVFGNLLYGAPLLAGYVFGSQLVREIRNKPKLAQVAITVKRGLINKLLGRLTIKILFYKLSVSNKSLFFNL